MCFGTKCFNRSTYLSCSKRKTQHPGNRRVKHKPLDQWIIDQKHAYTAFVTGKKRKCECKPALTEERVLLLKNAGFQLQEPVVAPPKKKKKKTDLLSDEMWDNMQQELREFKAVHGHTIPPVQPNTLLRQWVNKVRAEYNKFTAGDSSVLTAERIQSLNDVEFQFSRKYKPRTWEARFEELIKFKANFGHCKVPRLFDQANFEGLGKWVADQRAKYNKMIRGKKFNMTAEKAKQSASWEWYGRCSNWRRRKRGQNVNHGLIVFKNY